MSGQVLELSSDDASRTMILLNEAQESGKISVEEIALYGAQIHVVALDAEALIQPIGDMLRAEGIHPGQMDIIAPSLEDVFISCIRQEE